MAPADNGELISAGSLAARGKTSRAAVHSVGDKGDGNVAVVPLQLGAVQAANIRVSKQREGELQFGLTATKNAPNPSKTMVSSVKLAGTGEVIFPVNVNTSGGICPP